MFRDAFSVNGSGPVLDTAKLQGAVMNATLTASIKCAFSGLSLRKLRGLSVI